VDYGEAIAAIRDVLKANVPMHGSIAFSGGLDSTVLMHISGYRLSAYTAGFADSHDVARADEVSNVLGFRVNHIFLENVDLMQHMRLLKDIDGTITKQEIGYELILSVVLSAADGGEIVTGQGADEIFYGYRRTIESMNNVAQMKKLFERTLPREKRIAAHYGKELITPYLDSRIIDIAGSFGPDHHIRNGTGKAMIRDIARSMGLPESIYSYGKKAAQYGSGIDRYLKKERYFSIV